MAQPTLRELFASPDVKVGFWVNEFVTPAIGHILKAGGCDLVTFDMEHSGLGFESERAGGLALRRSRGARGRRRSSTTTWPAPSTSAPRR